MHKEKVIVPRVRQALTTSLRRLLKVSQGFKIIGIVMVTVIIMIMIMIMMAEEEEHTYITLIKHLLGALILLYLTQLIFTTQ